MIGFKISASLSASPLLSKISKMPSQTAYTAHKFKHKFNELVEASIILVIVCEGFINNKTIVPTSIIKSQILFIYINIWLLFFKIELRYLIFYFFWIILYAKEQLDD